MIILKEYTHWFWLIKFEIVKEEKHEQMKSNLWTSINCKKYVFQVTWLKLNWTQRCWDNPQWLRTVVGKIA